MEQDQRNLITQYMPSADLTIMTEIEKCVILGLIEAQQFDALKEADALLAHQKIRLHSASVKLKSVLTDNRSYYGYALTRLCVLKMNTPFHPSQTAYTNGKGIFFNPYFFSELTIGEINFLILHEMYHIIFQHCVDMPVEARSNPQFASLWNQASDYIINHELIRDAKTCAEMGLPVDPIEGGCYMKEEDGSYKDLSNETSKTLYSKLVEEMRNQQGQPSSSQQGGQGQQEESQQEGQEQSSNSQQGESSQGSQSKQGSQGEQDQQDSEDSQQSPEGQGSCASQGNEDGQESQEGQGDSEDTQESQDKEEDKEDKESKDGQANGEESQKSDDNTGGKDGNKQSKSYKKFPSDDIHPADPDEAEVTKDKVQSVLRQAKSEGYSLTPGSSLDNLVYSLLVKPKIKWNRYLRRFLSAIEAEEVSYATPNKRYLSHDLMMPGPGGSEDILNHVTLMIDTSGSISKSQMEEFLAEALAIAKDTRSDLTICLWHTEVYEVMKLETQEDIEEIVKAVQKLKTRSGGTMFECCMQYMREEKYASEVYIIFTDGEFHHFQIASRIRRKILIALDNTLSYNKELDMMGRVVNQ